MPVSAYVKNCYFEYLNSIIAASELMPISKLLISEMKITFPCIAIKVSMQFTDLSSVALSSTIIQSVCSKRIIVLREKSQYV